MAEEQRSPQRGMCAAILSLEAVVLGLTTPVMINLSDVAWQHRLRRSGSGCAWPASSLAGLLRSEAAYVAGWVIQVAALALGFVIPLMFVLGAIFALLWGTAYFLGRKIERERAEAYALFRAERQERSARAVAVRRGRATTAASARPSSSSVQPPKPMIRPGQARGAAVVTEQRYVEPRCRARTHGPAGRARVGAAPWRTSRPRAGSARHGVAARR